MNINEEIKKCEENLKIFGVNYHQILANEHKLEGQDSNDANFIGGILSVLYLIKSEAKK